MIAYTTDMKKLAIFLLTVFTMTTAAVCGCDSAKASSYDDKVVTESAQIETIEEGQTEPECPDGEDGKCPNAKDDGRPAPRRPHKRHNKKLPRPESAYRKHK